MIKVCCVGCGVVRLVKIDIIMTEINAKGTATKVCPVCGCPYVEEVK